jgi:hypothetical protein
MDDRGQITYREVAEGLQQRINREEELPLLIAKQHQRKHERLPPL